MTKLESVNPVTFFAAAIVYSLPMLLTIDLVSAAVALTLWAIVFGWLRVSPVTIVQRAWPLLLAAPLSAVSMLLYAKPGGEIYGQFWLATISENSVTLALAVLLRVLAIGVPMLVIMVGIDPTRLGDGLAQVAKLPARFVLASLAGIRLFDVLRDDWAALTQARRARGLGDHGTLKRFFTMAFAVLVTAIRRGSALATAMEARAFGAGDRTWARESTLSSRDAIAFTIPVLIGVVSVTVAAVCGTFRLVGT